jgi:hypothetical protein
VSNPELINAVDLDQWFVTGAVRRTTQGRPGSRSSDEPSRNRLAA